jgi:hypothetical protein
MAMNYNLNKLSEQQEKTSTYVALKKLLQLIEHERKNLYKALIAILSNSTLNLLGPLILVIPLISMCKPNITMVCSPMRAYCWLCIWRRW